MLSNEIGYGWRETIVGVYEFPSEGMGLQISIPEFLEQDDMWFDWRTEGGRGDETAAAATASTSSLLDCTSPVEVIIPARAVYQVLAMI